MSEHMSWIDDSTLGSLLERAGVSSGAGAIYSATVRQTTRRFNSAWISARPEPTPAPAPPPEPASPSPARVPDALKLRRNLGVGARGDAAAVEPAPAEQSPDDLDEILSWSELSDLSTRAAERTIDESAHSASMAPPAGQMHAPRYAYVCPEGPLEARLAALVDWALDEAGAREAFVADHDGLLLTPSDDADIEAYGAIAALCRRPLTMNPAMASILADQGAHVAYETHNGQVLELYWQPHQGGEIALGIVRDPRTAEDHNLYQDAARDAITGAAHTAQGEHS